MRVYISLLQGSFSTKNLAVLLLMLFINPAASFASTPKQQFESANKEYRFGNYDKAVGLYEQLIKNGYRSSALYFNLGNAYYKTTNYAKAIVNYERALKLNPQDDDIRFNLRLTNLSTVDKIEPIPRLFYEQWWENFISRFNSDTWSKSGIICCWLTLLFAAIYIFSNAVLLKKTGFFGVLIFFLAGTFLLIAGRIQHQRLYDHKSAIILETSAYIKSSPEEKSMNLFMLHAGTKIEIVDELQGWKKIKIANGNVGWVNEKDLEII